MDPETLQNSTSELVETSVELVSTWGLNVIGAIAVLILGRWIASAMRKGTRRSLERGNVDPSLVPFLSSMTYYAVLTVVVIAVLNHLARRRARCRGSGDRSRTPGHAVQLLGGRHAPGVPTHPGR